jgi:hypothetical protein
MVMKIPLSKGKVALVDDEDFDWLNEMSWHCSVTNEATRHYSVDVDGKRRWQTFRMHRVIMEAEKGEIVDHINGDRLDNRRANLRVTDRSGNARNRKKETKRKTSSRFKGVTRKTGRRQGGKWAAQIAIDGGKISLGVHEDEEIAARIYDAAARLYFGEHARLNFPNESEQNVR